MFYKFIDIDKDTVIVNINSISLIFSDNSENDIFRILFNNEDINDNVEIYIYLEELKKFESWLFNYDKRIK